MPWDYATVRYRPSLPLKPSKIFEMRKQIVKNQASFWGVDEKAILLPNEYPEEFVNLEDVIHPIQFLLKWSDLSLDVLKIIVEYGFGVAEEFRFPEMDITPVPCSDFVCKVILIQTRLFQLNLNELSYYCVIPIMPDDLLLYGRTYAPIFRKKFIEQENKFGIQLDHLPSPLQLYQRWKEEKLDEPSDAHDALQNLLFCFQCIFLGRNGFGAICTH